MKKKDWINILTLSIFYLVLVVIISGFNNYYGSVTDWTNQHFYLPEYFRTLFYDTYNLIPDYAFNLGSGQNIYYFAYYGLLSPIILISYLFPFIEMVDYIIISSIIITILDIVLMYKWLKNKCDTKTCFIATFIFICAIPIIFHSHRHIMFVNYMPFLLLGLMGVDKYFNENKKWLLTLSVFLIIMTSYFFSVGALIAITIYGINIYLKKYKFTIKSFIKEGISFAFPIIIGVLMACILLLPVVYTLLNGRDQTTPQNIINLLMPNFSFSNFTYSAYSMGLSAISLICLLNAIIKREDRFMGIIILLMLIFPIFNYMLNGTLYLNSKAFIPFIPLAILLVSKNLEIINYRVIILIFIILLLTLITNTFGKWYLYLDLFISLIVLFIYPKFNKIIYVLFIFLTIITININKTDNLAPKDSLMQLEYKTDPNYRVGTLIESSLNVNNIENIEVNTTNLYSSVFNKNYNKFYYDVFNNAISYRNRSITNLTDNIIFNNFMGVKYIVSDYDLGLDYEKIDDNLYESKNSNTIGFVTYNKTNKDDFDNLSYPYNIYNLVNGVVTDDVTTNINSKIEKFDLNYEVIESDIDYKYKSSIYKLDLEDTKNIKIKTDLTDDYILFIRFDMLYSESCSFGDTAITIQNVRNKLTCRSWKYHNQNYTFDYVLYNNLDEIDIRFEKGKYEIANIETYKVKKSDMFLDNTKFNVTDIKGDFIYGNVEALEDGYFILTVPYDKGYTIYVDEVKTNVIEVNSGLVGFKIDKGYHDIKIEYRAPLKNVGLFISLIGFILFLLELRSDKKWKKSL